MVASTPTQERITAGEELLALLDEAGLQVDVALWFYLPDSEEWRLLLSLPTLIKRGPKAAYRAVQKAVSKLPEDNPLLLDDVTVAEEDAPLFQLLKKTFKKRSGSGYIGLSNCVIRGQLIEGALIYRLQ